VSQPIISFKEAEKVFPGRGKRPDVRAVDGVTFDIMEGEIFGVIGYSGAGKSTLVRLINALEKPTGGSVVVGGTEIVGLSEAKLRTVRAGIGMVFQQFNLLGSRTVAGNVAYPLEVAGWDRAARKARVAELLDYVGIADKADARPSQLSGGQRQRVGIARALATSPKILLADEATSALDPETTQDVLRLLQQVNKDLGVTVVVITHGMNVVRYLCDRVAVMEHGKVAELGNTYDVFANPQAAVTKKFVGTALKDRPEGDVLDRLRARHPGRLVTVAVNAKEYTGIFNVLAQHNVSGKVVYGGITEVGDLPYGSITWELSADSPQVLDTAVNALYSVASINDLGDAAHPKNSQADTTEVAA
jgi:D-methionine transport system ATP-binding protein